jgi:aminomethyltransferase
MNRSPLHDRHLELGARMLPFAGWEMPIQYEGIVAEHHVVREKVGVFDISHMGELVVRGAGAEDWLNGLLTNDVSDLADGEGQYTLMLDETGGVIDDLILYRRSAEDFFLVVNASKLDEDVEWLSSYRAEGVELINQSSRYGALAVQGPASADLWATLEPALGLPDRNGIWESEQGLILCRTGYTGEDGFELFAPVEQTDYWFSRILEAGAVPCGLGARDTLRLEKCYPLNGSDLDGNHTPLEAGLGFFVKLEKAGGFPGKETLINQKKNGLSCRLTAIAMSGKAPPPRHGYEVRDEEGEVVLGTLTSGSMSPSLGKGIGLAYLAPENAGPGTALSIAVRDRVFPAEVVKKPFL